MAGTRARPGVGTSRGELFRRFERNDPNCRECLLLPRAISGRTERERLGDGIEPVASRAYVVRFRVPGGGQRGLRRLDDRQAEVGVPSLPQTLTTAKQGSRS